MLNSEPCYDSLFVMDSVTVGSAAAAWDTGARPERRRFDRKDVRRTCWVSVLSGANAGISYGAHGTWPWHRDGLTYGPMHYGLPLDWRRALVLESGEDVAHLRRFMESLPWWDLEPAAGLVVDPEGAILGCATAGRDMLLAYLAGPARVKLPARLSATVAVSWMDPTTGEMTVAAVSSPDAETYLESPFGAEDSVLILKGNLSGEQ